MIMGGKYIASHLQIYLVDCDIEQQTFCIGTPRQNGVAERKNRHLLEVTRALLFSMNVCKTFWFEAPHTVANLINYAFKNFKFSVPHCCPMSKLSSFFWFLQKNLGVYVMFTHNRIIGLN